MAKDWGTIYHNAVIRGLDHGYAAYLADEWEARKMKQALIVDEPTQEEWNELIKTFKDWQAQLALVSCVNQDAEKAKYHLGQIMDDGYLQTLAQASRVLARLCNEDFFDSGVVKDGDNK